MGRERRIRTGERHNERRGENFLRRGRGDGLGSHRVYVGIVQFLKKMRKKKTGKDKCF